MKPHFGLAFLLGMRLRWRLVIAFLSVSALPVLFATYIAADIISSAFASSMEGWLEEAAVLFAQGAPDDAVEARQAANIIAVSLAGGGDNLNEGLIDIGAQLLTSVGYDAVAVYDEDGRILFRRGPLGDAASLPRTDRSSFFLAHDGDQLLLLMGAAKQFERDGRRYFAFVADRWDGTKVDMADSVPGLTIEVYAVSNNRVMPLGGNEPSVPPGVIDTLADGRKSVIAKMPGSPYLASGFAALRDLDGRLVGIVTSRLANQLSLLSHLRTWELFIALSAVAGIISLLVALSLSKVISRPLTQLTAALRNVREGEFKTRVGVSGGGELTELAVGFNQMAARLELMRDREAQVRRRERLATLGEAAAVLAHEIRNPLGIIKTSSQVLRLKSSLSPEADRLVGFVLDEVGRIDHLVHDLLDYARPRTLQRRAVDVAQELADVLAFAAHDLEQRGIRVAKEGSSCASVFQGDPEQLHQVLLNIVLNAMDAMPTGGVLTHRIDRHADWIIVSLRDTGKGVDPEIGDRLFEPFVTTKPRGTGLGLARVRHIIEQHGGTVAYESTAGAGTCFILRLPVAPPDREALT